MAYQRTDRPVPSIEIDHPMQNVTPEVLRRRAEQIADAAQRLFEGRWDR